MNIDSIIGKIIIKYTIFFLPIHLSVLRNVACNEYCDLQSISFSAKCCSISNEQTTNGLCLDTYVNKFCPSPAVANWIVIFISVSKNVVRNHYKRYSKK